MRGFPDGIFKRNFDPGFQLDLAAKDVGLATQLGRELRVPMEMSNIAQQRYIAGQNKGYGRMAAGAGGDGAGRAGGRGDSAGG